MEKIYKALAIAAAIIIPLVSYVGTSAVLFHRVGQLEKQDTSQLEERVTRQWSILGEIRRKHAEIIIELVYTKNRINRLEQLVNNRNP